MALLLVGLFGIFLILGVPIAISMGISSIIVLYFIDLPLVSVVQKMTTGIDSFLFIAIPLFILTGQLMNSSQITNKIFNFANTVVGKIPGGLGHGNILASVIFAGMSGSAIADAGGLGSVEIKAMKDNGFDVDFAGAVTASSSVVGPIIPPSIPMLIYAGIAEVSVGKLFIGGIIPGTLMALSLSITVFIYSIKRKYPIRKTMTWNEIFKSSKEAIIPLITPIIILFGITLGIFTATEASAVAAFYSLIVGIFVYRSLGFQKTLNAFGESIATTGNILFIISCAALYSYLLNQLGVAKDLTEGIFSVTKNPLGIMIIVNIIIFIMGMFMESGAILTMLIPVLLPLVKLAEIDLIYFGVIVVLNLMLGTITPPIGICLFVVSKICGISVEKLTKATIPFIIPLFIVISLCIIFPKIVMWLPDLVG